MSANALVSTAPSETTEFSALGFASLAIGALCALLTAVDSILLSQVSGAFVISAFSFCGVAISPIGVCLGVAAISKKNRYQRRALLLGIGGLIVNSAGIIYAIAMVVFILAGL
jgi:hypothetical protein